MNDELLCSQLPPPSPPQRDYIYIRDWHFSWTLTMYQALCWALHTSPCCMFLTTADHCMAHPQPFDSSWNNVLGWSAEWKFWPVSGYVWFAPGMKWHCWGKPWIPKRWRPLTMHTSPGISYCHGWCQRLGPFSSFSQSCWSRTFFDKTNGNAPNLASGSVSL